MLSVRRRQKDVGGAPGMEDDAELEEGEAWVDDTAFVDPDFALSYIDDKLQDVLGHFQKDFEGGVSAENLGSKFGGYGSFLPTYQRSPPQPQTRSLHKAVNLSSRSPYHQSTKGVSQNSPAVAVPSVSHNNGSVVPLSGDSSKKGSCESTKTKRGSSTHDPSYGPSKCSDQNRLKVLIKVGSDNVLARNNAVIYSGLGLDILSPSSIEDSPDARGSLSPEFDNVRCESPRTILQIMTCFSVPGGFLLSPLQDSVLQLAKKVVPSKKWETSLDIENVKEAYEGHVIKKMKSDGKKKKSIDMKKSNNKNDFSAVLKKEIDIETTAGQKVVSESLDMPLLSSSRAIEAKGRSQFKEQSAEKNLQGNKDIRLEEWAINSDSVVIKAQIVKAEETDCLESSCFGRSEMDFSAAKRELKPLTEKIGTAVEENNTTNDSDFLLDRKQERKIKPESNFNDVGVNFEGNRDVSERAPVVCRSTEKVPSKETLLYDTNAKHDTKSEAKRNHRDQKTNASTSSDVLDADKGAHSSAATKERKNDFQSKSSHSEKKSKGRTHRDSRDNFLEVSYVFKERDILENGSGLVELQPKEKSWSKKDSDMPGTSKREISSSAKHDRHTASEEQKVHVPSSSVPTTNAAPVPPVLQAPVVIEEHWVQCDICQKWRLLPYEMDSTTLPKKWKCSMQVWLPGMNRCDVGEDKTTNALNALYVIPAPANGIPSVGHTNVASTGPAAASAFNINGHTEQNRKRKSAPIDGNGLVDGSHPTQASVYPTSNQHAPARSKTTADGSQYSTERDSLGKSVDIFTEKKKSKSKNRDIYSAGVNLVERSKKHSKVKSKREMDHGEYKASKKIKKEDRHHSGKDLNRGCNLASGGVLEETKALSSKSLGEKSDISSSNQKHVLRYDHLEKSKRAKDEDIVLSEDGNREQFHTSDIQRSDFSNTKRKVKEWEEENQHNSIARASKGSTKHVSGSSDVVYSQAITINSSSSKGSGLQKKKQNSQVANTSPAEFVPSSPPRNSNIDKLSRNRILEKDGYMKGNPNTMLSSEKYLNSEESLLASEPVLHGPSQGNYDKDDKLMQSTQGLASEMISLRKGLDGDLQHASGRKESAVNGSSFSRGYDHLHSDDKNRVCTDVSLVQPRIAALEAKGEEIVNEKKKSVAYIRDRNGSTYFPPSGNPQPEALSGSERSYPKNNKQDTEKPKAHMVPSPLKESHSTPVKSVALKLTPQSRQSNDENGGQHGAAKQATSNHADTSSPARKDGNLTACALKEARDLKHKANRLKKEGKDPESTRLYFEAALKFLHVASLLEPPSIDGLKQGDAAQSMYSDTAKLCNFVGHEYERCKKMAAASLAYKCVEVAYLKAAYYKYPIASKDRQVLQSVVQTTPGESPSSSASDIDNLNNNGLSKAALSSKDANSPQVTGNHLLLAARNQPHLTRLLAYTNDVNCAFEATRKSQTAIASAVDNHDKGTDGLSSVRTVLDFNFRSVNDLLRLVRLAMESIRC